MIAGLDGLRLQHWHLQQRDDGVVVLSFDRHGAWVNTFAQEVLIESSVASAWRARSCA